MEPLIRRLLLAWLLLLGGVLLTYYCGYAQLAYWLLWPVALTTPVAAGLLLWLQVLRLRELWHRVRVLWRARHWRRKRELDDSWMDTPWQER